MGRKAKEIIETTKKLEYVRQDQIRSLYEQFLKIGSEEVNKIKFRVTSSGNNMVHIKDMNHLLKILMTHPSETIYLFKTWEGYNRFFDFQRLYYRERVEKILHKWAS